MAANRPVAEESFEAAPRLKSESTRFPAISDLEPETAKLERENREQLDGNWLGQCKPIRPK
jgi:hypothetical protein